MDVFEVIKPSAWLAPYIKQYWFVRIEYSAQAFQRLVPFGSPAVSFHRGRSVYSSALGCLLPPCHIYGQSTIYRDISYTGLVDFVSVIFHPLGAKAFLKIPLHELQNRVIALDDLSDSHLSQLQKQITNTADNRECVRLIEHFLLKRFYNPQPYPGKRLSAVMNAISNGQNQVGQLSQTACLSHRQFRRFFNEYVGLSPQNYLRIMRFQKIVSLLQTKPQNTLADLAEKCGYYDKSHMIREMREFSGYVPSELLSDSEVYSDYHSFFRSAFLEVRQTV